MFSFFENAADIQWAPNLLHKLCAHFIHKKKITVCFFVFNRPKSIYFLIFNLQVFVSFNTSFNTIIKTIKIYINLPHTDDINPPTSLFKSYKLTCPACIYVPLTHFTKIGLSCRALWLSPIPVKCIVGVWLQVGSVSLFNLKKLTWRNDISVSPLSMDHIG